MAQKSAINLQLHTPTGVTHSASAFLTVPPPAPGTSLDDAHLPDLAVVKGTVLEIYAPRKLDSGDIKLELIAQQRLFVVVESLAVLRGRSGRSGRDAILLAFRDAKVSVLQWDPTRSELTPSSLHYFEGDESLKAGRQAFARPPLVVTDPSGRCAAVIMLRHQLAVLPATESESAALGMVLDDPYSTGANVGSASAASGDTIAAAVGNSFVDNLSKMNIREIRDAVFLYGSSEPTLLVLHEADPTWAGNLRSRNDTCVLTALSLNLTAKRHPRIWSVQHVPSDAYRLVACPFGGALVLTATTILYYAQGQQAGVVLHSAALPARQAPPPLVFDLTKGAPGETAAKYGEEHAMELHPQAASAVLSFCDTATAGWNLECDAAHAAWLSRSTALLGLKTGQLLLVEVVRAGGGTVKLRVAKAGAAPIPSTITTLSSGVAFIGSSAGDSLLIGCSLSGSGSTAPAADKSDGGGSDERETKRRRLESSDADHVDKNTSKTADDDGAESDEDEDALLLYGTDGDNTSSQRCSLQVLDSFIGIGPIRSLTSSLSGASSNEAPYVLACCGKDKGGALAVLRRSVVADIMTEVPLPEVVGAWAVGFADEAKHHSYLILSFAGSTKVLSTGELLKEVTDSVEFAGDVRTLAAGTVAGGKRVLQAFPQGLRLLEKGEQKQEIWAEQLASDSVGNRNAESEELAVVHILDPFVLVQTRNGTAYVLQIDQSTGDMKNIGAVPSSDSSITITACCLYEDRCGWMMQQSGGGDGTIGQYLCVACYSDGSCSIWALSDGLIGSSPVWSCQGISEGRSVLSGSSANSSSGAQLHALQTDGSAVVEIKMESFDAPSTLRSDLNGKSKNSGTALGCAAPMLVALTNDNTLLAYKAFACVPAEEGASIKDNLRFKRLHLDAPAVVPPASPLQHPQHQSQRIYRFDGIGEQIPHSGLFVSGTSSLWLVASRGTLFAHPLHMSSPTVATCGFTPFHNINSPHGFITVCCGSRSCIQIAGLPPRQRLDAPWPRQKIAIKATPHKVCLYPEAQLFALLASHTVPYKPFLPEEEGGEPQASYSYALAAAASTAHGTLSQHEIRLVQPGSWATVWKQALLPGEVALSVEAVHLRDTTTGATVPLLAVGAGFNAGEDYPCSGRVLVFEIRRSTNAAGIQSWGGELIFSREFKGPVTGLATMEGHLLLSTGHRLETLTLSTITQALEGGDTADAVKTTYKFQRSAFYDGPSLVTSLCTVKSFVLTGDATHSVQFVRYKEDGRQLALLGKDFGRASVRAAQFLIAGSSLHIAMADAAGSLRTFTYAPGDASTWKGQKLLPWGVMHIGQGIGAMARLKMPQPDDADVTPRQAVVYGSDCGGIGAVMPLAIGEHLMQPKGLDGSAQGTMLSALKTVQDELVAGMPHGAGLNPAAFRRRHVKVPQSLEGSRPYGSPLTLKNQGLLDGDVLMRYAWLPRAVQVRIASKAGVKREEVLAVLAAIYKTSCLM